MKKALNIPPNICETLEYLRHKLGSMREVQKLTPQEIVKIHHELKSKTPPVR